MIKLFLACLLLTNSFLIFAQDEPEEEKRGFKKENLFAGGSITVTFFNNQTILGANPFIGYKLTDWADAGIAANFVYTGARHYLEFDDRVRQTVYGPGVFARLYPVRFLFVQGQFEHNFVRLKYKPGPNPSFQAYDKTTSANSLLVGGGIAQGREKGGTTFYYISILFDVLKNINSPYVNVQYDPNVPGRQSIEVTPIIRAGINIGLFQRRFRD